MRGDDLGWRWFTLCLAGALSASACKERTPPPRASDQPAETTEEAPPATPAWYRARLLLGEVDEIPFYVALKDGIAVLQNGEETVETKLEREGDRVRLPFPLYETAFHLAPSDGGGYRGRWERRSRAFATESHAVILEPVASPDPSRRFEPPAGEIGATADPSGSWKVSFGAHGTAKLRLERSGPNVLLGAMQLPNGNYVYLAGNVFGSKVLLSAVDGQFNYLLRVELDPEARRLEGEWITGEDARYQVSAEPASALELPNPVEYRGAERPNIPALSSPKYAGKPLLIELTGSWCPHCHEAALFLKELYGKYRGQGLEVFGLGYEFTDDPEFNERQIEDFRKKYGVPWEIIPVHGSAASFEDIMPSGFEGMDISGFPFVIFVNRDGTVREVIAGYASKATGEEHQRQRARYEGLIQALLASPAPGK